VLPHPDRDVALVRLAADLPAAATPVTLATAPAATGESVYLAGYGRTATECTRVIQWTCGSLDHWFRA